MKKRLLVIVFLAVGVSLGLSANAFAVGGSNAECPYSDCPIDPHPKGPALIGDFDLTMICAEGEDQGAIRGDIKGKRQGDDAILHVEISPGEILIDVENETYLDCTNFASLNERDLSDFFFVGYGDIDGETNYGDYGFYLLMGVRGLDTTTVEGLTINISGDATVLYAVD